MEGKLTREITFARGVHFPRLFLKQGSHGLYPGTTGTQCGQSELNYFQLHCVKIENIIIKHIKGFELVRFKLKILVFRILICKEGGRSQFSSAITMMTLIVIDHDQQNWLYYGYPASSET